MANWIPWTIYGLKTIGLLYPKLPKIECAIKRGDAIPKPFFVFVQMGVLPLLTYPGIAISTSIGFFVFENSSSALIVFPKCINAALQQPYIGTNGLPGNAPAWDETKTTPHCLS